jgi:type IV pilus assembly protein PilN
VALSNESIADFMRNLESSPYVEKGSVNLTHSRQKVISNMKLREFQVTYRFYPFSEVQKQLKAQAS